MSKNVFDKKKSNGDLVGWVGKAEVDLPTLVVGRLLEIVDHIVQYCLMS